MTMTRSAHPSGQTAPSVPNTRIRSFHWQLLALTCLAAALRLYHLSGPGLWIDELFTVRDAVVLGERVRATPVKALGYVPTAIGLKLSGVDVAAVAPTGYAQWPQMGIDPWSMRIAACIMGIVTIPLLGWASRSLLGDRAALLFALLLAMAPWHIYWSQGARFYSQKFLFAGLALALYLPATAGRPAPWRIAAAFLFAVLGFLSQITAGVVALVFAVDWVVSRIVRQPARLGLAGWAAAILAALVCGGLLAYELTRHSKLWQESFDSGVASPASVVLGTIYFIGPSVVVAAVFAAWGLFRRQPRHVLYLLAVAILPVAFFAGLSMRQYSGTRYAFPCLFGGLALAALGLAEIEQLLRPRAGRVLAQLPLFVVLASLAVTLSGYYTYSHAYRERWQEAFAYVAEHRQTGQDVRCDQVPLGQYYLQDPTVLPPVPRGELASVQRPTWFVVRAALPMTGLTDHWIGPHADLRKYFDVFGGRPITSVRVYFYEPH